MTRTAAVPCGVGHPRRLPRLVLVAAVASTLAACSSTVAIDDPPAQPDTEQICAAVMAALPTTVLDQPRRRAEPGVRSAAWGKPAITLRCGVPRPPGLRATSECFSVNDVGWFAEQGDGGYLFTTIGRPAYIEMGVPSRYAPEANALVAVASAIAAHDPELQPCA